MYDTGSDTIITAIILFCIGSLVVGLLFVGFLLSSVVAGDAHYEYRCVQGVVEARKIYWGLGIKSMTPIDGDPAGACKERGDS